MLITSDEWEVDCRQLKFASHIGQGAFGKVVTGYYQDQRVAIKLVRGTYYQDQRVAFKLVRGALKLVVFISHYFLLFC